MNEKVSLKILEDASKLDRNLGRKMRVAMLESFEINKIAENNGVLQGYQGNVLKYETRPHRTAERGIEKQPEEKKLYNTGPEHPKSDPTIRQHSKSLSTRYSPDRVGIQARRIADGVYQDPYTNKIYDWNKGFTTENGEVYGGGGVDLQTDLFPTSK